ncbi:MAG: Nitrogen regulatory protein P-II [Lentisphaerae bacterium ADurb.BinA184]|nr:MAG: Nitrogen regulatory protein P-II [Lentisphaerae bacterium ADurb.BinA184]
MKRIEAIVRPERLDVVRRAIEAVGYAGLMITEIQGHGKQKGITQQWRGEKFRVELLPKVKIEIVAPDHDVETILEALVRVARTGEIGDGKIFVSPVDTAIRIRTGERGDPAL